MAESEGVIQYKLDFDPGPLPSGLDLAPLFAWFARCRQRGLIGRDLARYSGYAYGNISLRASPGFVISGTQTGGHAVLGPDDLAWVTDFDSATNTLQATGLARPSSEAMTHGEVYRTLPGINAIIHAHTPTIWRAATRLDLPRTDPSVTYGTPAMADEVRRLLSDRPAGGVLAMGGHEDGIIAFAGDMDSAGQHLLGTLERAEALEPMSI